MDVGFRRAADDVEGCHFVDGNLQQVRNRGTIASVQHPHRYCNYEQADSRCPAVRMEIKVEGATKTASSYWRDTPSIWNNRNGLDK